MPGGHPSPWQRFEITQGGASCPYVISPSAVLFTPSGGSGQVAVNAPAGCSWSASSQAGWITITGGASGSGDGVVNYLVAAHGGSDERSGTLTIAGHPFTVDQNGIDCSFAINPPARTFGSSGGTGTVRVYAAAGCGWTAASHEGGSRSSPARAAWATVRSATRWPPTPPAHRGPAP